MPQTDSPPSAPTPRPCSAHATSRLPWARLRARALHPARRHGLRLGANPDTVTLTHYAEYLCDVPDKRRARRRSVRADLGEQWIESLDDTDGIADWAQGDDFPQIFLDHRSSGGVALAPVGGCVAEAFGAKAFVAFATAWMNAQLGGR